MIKTSAVESQNIDALKEALGNDLDLVLFYLTWLKNGMNATKAYLELHPNVDEHSARVLGSRSLAKVNKEALLEAYGLDYQRYFKQLDEGLNAMKQLGARIIVKKDSPTSQAQGEELPAANGQTTDFIEVPDHFARKPYHDKLGKLLGIESNAPAVQNNIFTLTDDQYQRIVQD